MTTEQIVEEKVETLVAPGLLLQNAREKQQLTLEDISSRLRLRVEVLEQIEADQFDMGKLATFTRGYYRSYAKVVNISEEKVLDALDQLGKAKIEQHDMQSFSGKTKREKHDNRIMKLTWVIFALILSMSVLWWWQEQAQLESKNDAELITEVAASEDQVVEVKPTLEKAEMLEVDTNLSELETDPSKLEQETADKPDVAVEPVDVATNSVDADVDYVDANVDYVDTNVKTPVLADSDTSKAIISEDVVMTFNDDCWLQVQDASNNRLYSGVKKANQTLKLTGKAPYKLVIGAPNSVTLMYKGKPVDLSAYPAGKVARLTLPQ